MSVHPATIGQVQLLTSLLSLEIILKRLHSQPHVDVNCLNVTVYSKVARAAL